MRRIFMDCDGTLIDISLRFYAVYSDILISNSYKPLPFEYYWKLRRKGRNTQFIISKTCPLNFVKEYYKLRNILFESYSYILKYDQIIVEESTLIKFKKLGYELVIISLRDDYQNLLKELHYFQIKDYFTDILTGPQFGDQNSKIELIKDRFQVASYDIIIGDTEIDILTGNYFNILSFGVLSGIRTKENLNKSKPFKIIENINELPEYLK